MIRNEGTLIHFLLLVIFILQLLLTYHIRYQMKNSKDELAGHLFIYSAVFLGQNGVRSFLKNVFFIKQRFHELFIRENFAPLCSVSGAESSGYWRNHYKNIRPKYTLQSTAPNCANIRSCYNMYFPKHSLKIGTANAIC